VGEMLYDLPERRPYFLTREVVQYIYQKDENLTKETQLSLESETLFNILVVQK
jgi:hypothetical protein